MTLDTGPSRRPTLTLGMSPELFGQVFTTAAQRELHRIASLDVTTFLTGAHPIVAADTVQRTEVLLTCWGGPELNGEVLAAMPRLRAVVHAAGSVKHIVTEQCRERGIVLSTAADANALPVAEFTVAMIVLANKDVLGIATNYRRLRSRWAYDALPADFGNYDRVVGVVGASRIGRRVIQLLAPLDGVRVILADPYVSEQEARTMGVELVDLDTLCARSDVVSLHAPALPSTRQMIGAERLARMRAGATLINTARGALVDHDALIRELTSGRLCAILDHTTPEILPDDSPLYELPNVLVTPHIAGSLGTELHRMGDSAVREVVRFVSGRPFHHPIGYDELEHSA